MSNTQNCAEVMDLMNTRIAIGLLIASFAYALDAASILVTTDNQIMLSWASFGMSLLSVLWIFRAIGPSLWKKLKHRTLSHQEPESFITDTFHQAIIKSWIITVIVLMVIKSLEQKVIHWALPVDFYFKVLIFTMLFSASIIFLVLTYVSDGIDQNEELV